MGNFETYEVYKLINIVNNKIYIGSTTLGSGKRFKMHVADSLANRDNYPIHQAIREFGENNFNLSVIEFCNSLEEMNKREAFYIAAFGSTNPEIGYNRKVGGGVRFQSEETKQKIGDLHRGKISDKRKPILQYDGKTGEFIQEYVSLSSAEEQTGIGRGSIIRVLNGKMNRPSKKNPFIWIYKSDKELVRSNINPLDFYKDLNYKPKPSKECLEKRSKFISVDGNFISFSKTVAKYDANGNEIARYNSLAEASRVEGNPSVITIKAHIKQGIGDWKYVEDNRTEEEKNKAQIDAAINAARTHGKKIIARSDSGEDIVFDTLSDAAKFAGNVDRKTLKYHMDKHDVWKGYTWEFYTN